MAFPLLRIVMKVAAINCSSKALEALSERPELTIYCEYRGFGGSVIVVCDLPTLVRHFEKAS